MEQQELTTFRVFCRHASATPWRVTDFWEQNQQVGVQNPKSMELYASKTVYKSEESSLKMISVYVIKRVHLVSMQIKQKMQ